MAIIFLPKEEDDPEDLIVAFWAETVVRKKVTERIERKIFMRRLFCCASLDFESISKNYYLL